MALNRKSASRDRNSMPSLLDIAPPELAGKDIDVHGQKLSIQGIVAEDWARLYARFPELRQLVAGQDGDAPDRLRMMQAQSAMIAAGTGHAGEREHERAVMHKLTADEQAFVASEIIALSMPGNVFGPLLDAEEDAPAAALSTAA